jgi:hypothetical protein
MLQKDSLLRFCWDNLLSMSGSKLYIGLFPVLMPRDYIKYLSTLKNIIARVLAHFFLKKKIIRKNLSWKVQEKTA